MNIYGNMCTADIVAEASIDWNLNFIFGLYGNGINGFIEALRQARRAESAAFMGLYIRKIYTTYYTSFMLRNYSQSDRPFKKERKLYPHPQNLQTILTRIVLTLVRDIFHSCCQL
jgi:hypothetical protein